MSRAIRDVDALELGFLADGVLQAIKALTTGGEATDRHIAWLKEGIQLLSGLAAGVGPSAANVDTKLQFASLASFPFAAEAVRTVPNARVSEGLRSYFGFLAETLKNLVKGVNVDEEDLDRVRQFFKAVAQATLDSWSSPKSPTLLGPERIPWATS